MSNVLRLNSGKVVEVHYFAPLRNATLNVTIPAGSTTVDYVIDSFKFNIDSPNNIIYFSGFVTFTADVTTGSGSYTAIFKLLRDSTPILENPSITITSTIGGHDIVFSTIDKPEFSVCNSPREVTYKIVMTITGTAPVSDEIITLALPTALYPASILAEELEV